MDAQWSAGNTYFDRQPVDPDDDKPEPEPIRPVVVVDSRSASACMVKARAPMALALNPRSDFFGAAKSPSDRFIL